MATGGRRGTTGPGRRAPRRWPAPAIWTAFHSPATTAALDLVALGTWLTIGPVHGRPADLVLLWVPVQLLLSGSYRWRIDLRFLNHLVPALAALAVPIVALGLMEPAVGRPVLDRIPAFAALLAAGRLLSYALDRVARGRASAEPALIVGAGRTGCQIAETLFDHPEYGIRPVGFVDDFPDDGTLPLPVVGSITTFDAAIRQTGARRVFVAYGANREPELVEMLRASTETGVEIHVVPRFFELGVSTAGPGAHDLWGFPIHDTRRADPSSIEWRAKRIFDVVVSGLGLLMAAPVMIVTAAAVRLTSRGPVLFRQQRVGQRGQTIEIYKFRSMRVSGDADTRWAGRNDERVTGVGRLIRATSIDELPQLINVLKGDMSLVGPRPERPHFSDQFGRSVYRYKDRLRVPVGLTGWAQVHGLRGDTSIEERARFDNYYIEHWSLWLDMVILVRTLSQVVQEIASHLRPDDRRREVGPEGGALAGHVLTIRGQDVTEWPAPPQPLTSLGVNESAAEP
ncbi:MAG TPA: exopolysaccharide biosynthesis polyprenyl glycosylphosphotransferase [Acidimicrobiales bacterium]|nr:exopolysaccharide biosynthesis polyprenyl glycosylphosphotransferase [Acidimicrobiales bacterium]